MTQMTAEKNIWHIIIGGTIGNLTEWYNFLLYGYLASVISKLFFPSQNNLLSLTLVFGIFALSFLVRPLGGILFGWIGDRYGRQRALVYSLLMMGLPTLLIGCLPTYQTIGIASPILLMIFRLMQGLSAGGEHTGSAIYVAEHAPARQRTFWVSAIPSSAACGILLSSVASLIILKVFTSEQLLHWGWRTGFWFGAIICLISLFLRFNLPETPYFERARLENNHHQVSILSLVKKPKILQNLFIVFLLSSSWGILYQLLFVWMPTYLSHIQNYSNSDMLLLNSLCILTLALLIVVIGYWGDLVSRKWLAISSSVTLFLLAHPLFLLLSSGSLLQIYIAMLLFTLIFSLFLPAAFVMMIEAFPTAIRYTGLSFSFNIGLAIFGGTAPLIATGLIERTHYQAAPAFYMMFAAVLGCIAALAITDKRRQSI